jgi:hypothetical protein
LTLGAGRIARGAHLAIAGMVGHIGAIGDVAERLKAAVC